MSFKQKRDLYKYTGIYSNFKTSFYLTIVEMVCLDVIFCILRRLDGHQINHQIYLKTLDMNFKSINFCLIKRSFKIWKDSLKLASINLHVHVDDSVVIPWNSIQYQYDKYWFHSNHLQEYIIHKTKMRHHVIRKKYTACTRIWMTLFTVVSISMDFPKTSSFESNGSNSMNYCQASLVELLNLDTCFKNKIHKYLHSKIKLK